MRLTQVMSTKWEGIKIDEGGDYYFRLLKKTSFAKEYGRRATLNGKATMFMLHRMA
jgi:hypothetical protein